MKNYEKPLLEIIDFGIKNIVSTANVPTPSAPSSSGTQSVVSEEDDWWATLAEADEQAK